jgi:hypothetical protein
VPSLEHQWLLLWIARKLTHDGYVVGRFEGPAPHGGLWNRLELPFDFQGRRPDAWAIHMTSGQIAIGEAKSASDLLSRRTLRQLRLFGRAVQRGTEIRCPLYIAVPQSSTRALDVALTRTGLIGRPHVHRLHIPDVLLGAPLHDCA